MGFGRAILAALLSPLVIIPLLPLLMFFESLIGPPQFDLRIAASFTLAALYFAYLGMLIFALPMSILLRATRRHFWLSAFAAGMAGFIASLTTVDILLLFDSPAKAWENFSVLLTPPYFLSMWVNYFSIAGIVVGISFFSIFRWGRYTSSMARALS